jgi:hypothetical protein
MGTLRALTAIGVRISRNIHGTIRRVRGCLVRSALWQPGKGKDRSSAVRRERVVAVIGRDLSTGPGSPDRGDAGSPGRDRRWVYGHGTGPASIRIPGHLGATLLSAFPAMVVEQRGGRNRSDQAGRRVSAARGSGQIETLGLDLVGASQLRPERESPQPGDYRSPRCNPTSGATLQVQPTAGTGATMAGREHRAPGSRLMGHASELQREGRECP